MGSIHFGEVLKRRLFEVKTFCPGDTVAQSGVYRVMHERHRVDHRVIVLAGDVLPPCCCCKGRVRFRLEEPINYATHDWDLTGPLFITQKKAASE